MSFVGDLLAGTPPLTPAESGKLGYEMLGRGMNLYPHDRDPNDRINAAIWNSIKPLPNSANTYDFWGDALAGPISDSGPNGTWVIGDDKKPYDPVSVNLPFIEMNDTGTIADQFSEEGSQGSAPSYSPNRAIANNGLTVDYLEADLAKHYKMDTNAAYGEALQNTAYRRAAADLKAAGFNPVLAVSGMNPAGSFVAGNTLARASGSGSSGAVSSNSGKYAMSSSLYNAIGAAASIVGAFIGYKTGGNFKFLNAATVSALAKNLTQAAIQGYSSLKNHD